MEFSLGAPRTHLVPELTSAGARFDRRHLRALRRDLAAESRFGDPIDLVREHRDHVWVPRNCAPLGKEDRRVLGARVEYRFTGKPRGREQSKVIGQSVRMLRRGRSWVTKAEPGFGKTVTTIAALAKYGRKALIVVPKQDILNQWVDRILEFTDLEKDRVGRIVQTTYRVLDCPIVVGMLQSLALSDHYPASMRREFGVVVFDECHRVAADLMQEACWRFDALCRLGLSATPERGDGREMLVGAHVGPVALSAGGTGLKPQVFVCKTRWRVPRTIRTHQNGYSEAVPIPHSPGRTMHVVKAMAGNRKRNAIVAEAVAQLWRGGRKVVVFADTLKHIARLVEGVRERGVPQSAVGRYVGEVKQEERVKVARTRAVIFTTWKMMGEATDIPWLDACVFATPRANPEQSIGRILRPLTEDQEREHGKKPQPVVIDFVDSDSWVFKKYADKRRRFYERRGLEVSRLARRRLLRGQEVEYTRP